jgi:Ca2+-binding RTX toxin-like protein
VGGDGNDQLSGGGGKDALDGGRGNDKLTGGAEANSYKGGSGNDSVNARNGKRETVDCGSGKKDSASVDGRDKVKGCERVKRARR